MIQLEQVSKRYGRGGSAVAAVDSITLAIPEGAVWALVGPNGAGKSTLLSLVLGFIRPSAGRVTIAGESPRDYLRDHGAAYLPERFGLPARWRAADALNLLARLDGGHVSIDAAVARFGLEPHLDTKVGALSRGLLQRLGLAQALLSPRRLVVLDEPTEGLDPVWRIRLRDVVAELRAAGSTVIVASHDLGEVERVADRAVLLRDGAVREVLDTRDDARTAAWLITLAAPFEAATDAFPNLQRIDELQFTAQLSGPQELSERVGALIALGGTIEGVEPQRRPLEDRVRDALDGDA
jgi:ABC-2 type transport system ATP-binding protein